MLNFQKEICILCGKITYKIAKIFNKNGSAIPGKVALSIKPNILKDLSENCENIILITGSNGKTTSNHLLSHIIKGSTEDVISNYSGSNMIQGVITPLLLNSSKKYKWGVFEVDEGSLENITQYLTPDYIYITNIFKDQLDRYGEIENTIKLIHNGINNSKTKLVLNAEAPSSLYFKDLPNEKIYFSQEETSISSKKVNVQESIYCPICNNKLTYDYINYGNIGKFKCENCGAESPKGKFIIKEVNVKKTSTEFKLNNNEIIDFPIKGIYNLYNALGVITIANDMNIDFKIIKERCENFTLKKGRMEQFKNNNNDDITLTLAKNPIGLTEVFRTITFNENIKEILFVLNDYPPDGIDVSWLWDVDFTEIFNIKSLETFYCVGTRAEDIAIRLKYEEFPEDKIKIFHSKDRTDIGKAFDMLLNEKGDKFVISCFTGLPYAKQYLMDKTQIKGE